ncbi:MAG: hypothetical protein HOQ28_02280, partial [Thermoleophilia bacterium]|nr:hypothetical protein [Thermoleophilia bacterium]
KSYTGLAQGSHTFQVRANDAAGNVDPTPATVTWTIDTVAPTVSITSAPTNPTNDTTPSFLFGSTDGSATFTCSLDNAAFSSCSPPIAYPGKADGQHTFSVKATDRAGNTGAAATVTWTIDTVAPSATISGKPASLSNVSSPDFAFTSSELNSTFQCKIDSEAFGGCSSPFNIGQRADGQHTFSVEAVDAAGNTGAPVTYTWTIDTAPPDTSLTVTAPSSASTRTTNASFSFSSEAGATFQCALDTPAGVGAFAACTSPTSYAGPLGEGTYAFHVRAIDAAGNTDGSPAAFTWTVDLTPPNTTITSAPGNPSGSSVSFGFTSSEGSSTFQCKLDSAAFADCSSPKSYTGLANASHTFSVQATDPAGNTDDTPATFTWTSGPTSTAQVFVSTGGSDLTCARLDSTKPCATFDKAFQIAQGGDVVEVAGGTYSAGVGLPAPEININPHVPPLSTAVTFQPASGQTVLLASDINIAASHFHMIGIKSVGTGDPSGGPDNTRRGLDVCDVACPTVLTDIYVQDFSGKSAFIRSSNVIIKGGEFGNYNPCADDPTRVPGVSSANQEDIFRIWAGGAITTPDNVVLDGVKIHDDDDHHTAGACPGATNGSAGAHVDCLQTQGGTNIVIKNTVMWNCATSNIQAQPFTGATMSDWTVENNFFGNILYPGNSLVLGKGVCTNLRVRYNTFDGPSPNGSGCTSGSIVGVGNVFLADLTTFGSNLTQTYSVFSAGTTAPVSGTNKQCNPSVVARSAAWPSGPNFHLLAGDTCAKGAGDPANFPSTDIDGDTRPSPGSTAPDAGADEIS